MKKITTSRWGKLISITSTVAVAAAGVSFSPAALAAQPHSVSYYGTRVTTAVPGKPAAVKFQVKNTGTTAYSGIKVIFHIPNGLQHSKVAPADADIHDDTVTWNNVPMAAGKSFYPSFTFTIDAGTPVNTKKSIWVEVTADDMEATSANFSLTAKPATATATTTLTSADIKSMFQTTYGRTPAASELTYWLGRRTDKPQRTPLLGAMAYHKAMNIAH